MGREREDLALYFSLVWSHRYLKLHYCFSKTVQEFTENSASLDF